MVQIWLLAHNESLNVNEREKMLRGKHYLLQERILLLSRKLLMISSSKRRYIKKGTVPLMLHLLKLLQIFFLLIRSYFSSSTKVPLSLNE